LFWLKLLGFMEAVQAAGHCPLVGVSPFRRLDWLLRNMTCVLQSWSDRCIGNVKMQLEIAKEVVLKLESIRDGRQLASYDEELRQCFKLRSLVLSSLQCTMARQESCLLWLSEEDAPMKFIHVHAIARHRKNLIRSLEHDGQTVVAEERKDEVAFEFFDKILGTSSARSNAINLDILDLCRANMPELCERFTEEVVWNVVQSLPQDKGPGLDGFTTCFQQIAWSIICSDLMLAFEAF
jgi:hypothetical protein